MRSGNKASLHSYLTKGIPNTNLSTELVQVIDGWALLYQVKWCLYKNFPIFISYMKEIWIANLDTAMLCLMVMETVPPQNICHI